MKIALLTSQEMGAFPKVDDKLSAALKKNGVSYDWFIWTEGIDQLEGFDTVLFRTIWDYWQKPEEFGTFLTELERSEKKVLNSIDTVRWNMDKRYLRELSEKGVQVVPSVFFNEFKTADIESAFAKLKASRAVLKPVFGAGAGGAFVITKDNWSSQVKDIESYYQNTKPAFIQPFLTRVQTEGEFSFHYFNKVFSHAILKTPKPGDYRSQEEFGSRIVTITPSETQLQYANSVLENVHDKLLYARVDFIMDEDKGPMLMELELIEPALYWEWSNGSEEKFINSLLNR